MQEILQISWNNQCEKGLLSHEQYEKLVELEELDLPSVVEIIKETKIEQGGISQK